ncbi:MAG: hypothetical protein K0R93_668 [Anaerosolibacter sp.]|jgi:hypothetical protein|uniref:DUF5659 domain-containing protein n=1 Tax=Anaerosolibacter sp. TaxID=1872527 RepID=UPI00262D217C|nr:DUF5659 domain-containing protein [Anaerosolibacter sp.]MDF2545770.1 hypothetical protein [Anaerosolibacter sp.]
MQHNKLIQITDKDLMVFLVASGHEIKKVQKDPERNRSLVFFEVTSQLNDSILAFTNKSKIINIGDYQAAERRVKTLLSMQKIS